VRRTSLMGISIAWLTVSVASAAEPMPAYPQQCTIDLCEQVVRISSIEGPRAETPRVVVVSTSRQALMEKPFPVYRSSDGRMHACMRYDAFGELLVSCLMLPSSD